MTTGPAAGAERTIELIGGFESTFQPAHDVDVAESTDHVAQRDLDLTLLRLCGLERTRYPIRWHRIERAPGDYDWDDTDRAMEALRDHGIRPIVDLVHHTSHPAWLEGGVADPRFGPAYLAYVTAVAERYPWIEEHTLFNEPFSTLFLCGHEAIWPPYGRGMASFVEVLRNVLPVIGEAARRYRDLLERPRHVHVDACERHTGESPEGERYAAYANDRRFFVLDALLGTIDGIAERPFLRELAAAGGADLLDLEPCPVDVVGLDYYAHCQWHFDADGGRAPSPCPPALSDVIAEYAARYARPVMLSETNIRGHATDRVSWFKYTLEQCEAAVAAGVEMDGYCWFPFIDSCDWDSLLFHCDRNVDPVGVFTIDAERRRHPTSMSVAYGAVGHGATSAAIPAYRLQQPVAGWLEGYLPQMSHWTWREPHARDVPTSEPGTARFEPLSIRDVA